MLKTILHKIGLDSQEILLYLSALKLGTQNIATFAKETRMPRSSVIDAAQQLIEKGFMSKFSRNQDFFTAESPDVIYKILEEQKISPSLLSSFRKNLPLFETYRNPSFIKPEIAFYEGKKGIIAAYEDTLTSQTEILAIASIDGTESLLPHYVPRYYQRRKTAGILIKAIFPDTKMARVRRAKDKEEKRISRLIPSDRYFFTMEINIYDDKVAYFSLKEKLAIIIKSADIALNMRHMFDLCWAMAEYYEGNRL